MNRFFIWYQIFRVISAVVRRSRSGRNSCFDPHKGIYADDPAHTFYDQHATILAILAGVHTQKEKKAMMRKVLNKDTPFDSRANLFYYFYLFEAMEKTQVGNFTNQLAPWEKAINRGLTTTPEKRIGNVSHNTRKYST